MPSIPRALLELGHRHHHHHHQEVELCPRPLNLGRPLSLLWPVDKVEVTSKVRSWQWHALPPGSLDMLGTQPPSCEEASKQPQEPVWTGSQLPALSPCHAHSWQPATHLPALWVGALNADPSPHGGAAPSDATAETSQPQEPCPNCRPANKIWIVSDYNGILKWSLIITSFNFINYVINIYSFVVYILYLFYI